MKLVKIYTTLFLCLLAIAQNAFAQGTPTLNIQGVLRNSNGTAVDNGTYQIRFALYTVATGGAEVWSETQASVPVSGGVYSTALGNTTPMTAAFDQTYYLGVKVGSGAEMTPRALLSSAPYALSLIGQGNTFPSSGAVGVGTNAPTAGNQLHAKNAAGAGKILVEGTTTANIDFKKGANTAGMSYDGTTISVPGTVSMPGTVNVGTMNATTLTATNFSFAPATLAVTSKLAVGQGTVDANNALKVVGSTYLQGFVEINAPSNFVNYGAAYGIYNTGSVVLFPASSTFYTYAMRANGYVSALGMICNSDRRIKKDFRLSNNITDLSTLQKLRVTDYRHIDAVQDGTAFKKGFIAQEVEEIFPEAVSQQINFIPDVYAISTRTNFSDGKLTISLGKNHGLAVGDEVKLMLETREKKVIVAAVPAENTFVVAWDEAAASDKIFVYGKKVSDFHTVDYDRIFTLNVSATQELARKVEVLEKENAALRQQVGELKTDAKASAEKVEARFRALENRLSN